MENTIRPQKNMNSRFYSNLFLLFAFAVCAAGCNKTTPTEAAATPKPMVNPTTPAESMAAKKPGNYCLFFKEGNHSIEGRLELAATNEVSGTLKGHQIDETTGTDLIYDTSFNGKLDGDSIRLSILSSETGSKSQTNETWIWKSNGIQKGVQLMQPIDCVN
jgi:hypothetical protein